MKDALDVDVPLEDVHPICGQVMRLFTKGKREPWVLDSGGVAALHDGLTLMDAEERPSAVQDLVKLAYCLESDHGCKQVAKAILGTIDKVGAALRQTFASSAKAVRDVQAIAGRRFAQFAGTAAPWAPSVNAPRPRGTTMAGHLGFLPRRV